MHPITRSFSSDFHDQRRDSETSCGSISIRRLSGHGGCGDEPPSPADCLIYPVRSTWSPKKAGSTRPSRSSVATSCTKLVRSPQPSRNFLTGTTTLLSTPSQRGQRHPTGRRAEPSPEYVESLLVEARRSLDLGQPRGAFLVAWSAIETAMGTASRREDLDIDEGGPRSVLTTLYSNGIISDEDREQLRLCMNKRDRRRPRPSRRFSRGRTRSVS